MSEVDEKRAFGRRLRDLLVQKGMIQSDLARLLWGKTTTKAGYTVAKNRSQIAHYIAGKFWPSPLNMKRIADELGVDVADLAPGFGAKAEIPEWSFIKIEGQDKVLLRINKLICERAAVEIIRLIGGAP